MPRESTSCKEFLERFFFIFSSHKTSHLNITLWLNWCHFLNILRFSTYFYCDSEEISDKNEQIDTVEKGDGQVKACIDVDGSDEDVSILGKEIHDIPEANCSICHEW